MPKEKASLYAVPKLKSFSAAALDNAVENMRAALDAESKKVTDEISWKLFRDRWISRNNGLLTGVNELWLKAAPKDAKREVGQRVNELKKQVEASVEEVKASLSGSAPGSDKLDRQDPLPAKAARSGAPRSSGQIDITLPGIRRPLGAEHPVIKTMNEIVSVFRDLGYSVQEGPEIETDYYNFEALNFPPNHPARDTQDTLFIANQDSKPPRDRLLLRTHTSPVQIRDNGGNEPSASDPDPWQSASERCAGRNSFAHFPSGRRAGSGYQHYFLRS